jgi:hypothetical protein
MMLSKKIKPKLGWTMEFTITGTDKETMEYITKMMHFHMQQLSERLPVDESIPITKRPCGCRGGGG